MKLTRRLLLATGAATFAWPVFAQEETSTVDEMFLGNPDAAVTVIEYASYTCPHCRRFHEGVYKDLKRDYIDTDKIKFVYREVYFDRPGLWASILARCGGGEKFFPITDMLYQMQSEWTQGDGAQIGSNLRRMGRIAGLDDETMNACFADREYAKALVANFQKTTSEDGVNSTPSFVINGTRYQNMSYAQMKEIIDDALGA